MEKGWQEGWVTCGDIFEKPQSVTGKVGFPVTCERFVEVRLAVRRTRSRAIDFVDSPRFTEL